MDNIIGEQTKYIMVQTTTNEEGESTRQPVVYSEYNFSFSTTQGVDSATKFDNLETVKELASLQNQLAKVMKKKFVYEVVQEDISRTIAE